MPVLIAFGSASQTSTTAANSGSNGASRAACAPHSAPLCSETTVFPVFSGVGSNPVPATSVRLEPNRQGKHQKPMFCRPQYVGFFSCVSGILMLSQPPFPAFLRIILILLLLGAVPTWPHSRNWTYGPNGGVGLILLIPIILLPDGAYLSAGVLASTLNK